MMFNWFKKIPYGGYFYCETNYLTNKLKDAINNLKDNEEISSIEINSAGMINILYRCNCPLCKKYYCNCLNENSNDKQ